MPRSSIDAKNPLSAAIRAAREAAGLSRSQVVEKAGLPSLTVAKLANIEIQRAPSTTEKEALERVLGATFETGGYAQPDIPSTPAATEVPAPPPAGLSTPPSPVEV
jgi:transcriptional regulator with XRE-family HTH domain